MWNDPGSPWHAQTGGPLLWWAYKFLYGSGKRQGRWYYVLGGKEKCFAGQLRSVRFIISHSERGARTARREHVTHPGPADSLILILTAVVGWWQVSGGGALLGVLHSVQTWFRLFSWDTQPVLHSAGNMTGWDLNEWGTVRFKTQELHIDTAHCKMKPKCHKAGSMSSSSHSYIDLKLCLFGQTGLYELMI